MAKPISFGFESVYTSIEVWCKFAITSEFFEQISKCLFKFLL